MLFRSDARTLEEGAVGRPKPHADQGALIRFDAQARRLDIQPWKHPGGEVDVGLMAVGQHLRLAADPEAGHLVYGEPGGAIGRLGVGERQLDPLGQAAADGGFAHAHQADKADGLARLGRRKLFKVELWSAPELGGVARCLIGQQDADWAGMLEFVLDATEVNGAPRFVAMYTPHGKCGGTGTLLKTGEPCTMLDMVGRPCLDGLIFLGGLSYDRGELIESDRIESPRIMKRWTSFMER